jgi:hypothetical protein
MRECAAKDGSREHRVPHAHNARDACAVAGGTEKILGRRPAYPMDISPAIGLNAGERAAAAAILRGEGAASDPTIRRAPCSARS